MIKVIKEVSKKDLKEFLYRELDINDPSLYEEMMNPNAIGIFQMTAGTSKKLVKEVEPENFEELNAVNALSRPGPLELVPRYIEGKKGAPSNYPSSLNSILEKTYGIPIFQEQIMRIFQDIGGFTLAEADEVRQLMKKLSKAEKNPEDLKKWDKTVKKFVKGASTNNAATEQEAKKIAEDLVMFSSYSFNRSHSVAYTYLAVITLYLSCYFRKYFYSATLTYEVDRDSYLYDRLQSVKLQGFDILPPDINESSAHIKPLDNNKIILGIQDVKFVGEKPTQKIIYSRPYSSLFDFIIKTRGREITSRVIESLIKVGAFDKIIKGERKKYLIIVKKFWENKKSTKVLEKLQDLWEKTENEISILPGLETTDSDLREQERELFGFNFFHSLFTRKRIEAIMKMYKTKLVYYNFEEVDSVSKKTPVCVNSIRLLKDKNGNDMAFLTLEDINGVNRSVPVFASYWKFIKDKIFTDRLYLFNLYLDNRGSILFGKKQYITNEFEIMRMAMEIN